MWHVSSSSGEACCELLRSVYLYLALRLGIRVELLRSELVKSDSVKNEATFGIYRVKVVVGVRSG